MRHALTGLVLATSFVLAVSMSRTTVHAQQGRSQWDGVYSDAQARRGEPLYAMHCAVCHGPDLTGGDMAPALVGTTFTSNWNQLTLGDLLERIRASMPQDNPDALTRAQKADVLAYMLSKGAYPAGQAELPAQTDALQSITFLAVRPESK